MVATLCKKKAVIEISSEGPSNSGYGSAAFQKLLAAKMFYL